jgi:hypothetical protein
VVDVEVAIKHARGLAEANAADDVEGEGLHLPGEVHGNGLLGRCGNILCSDESYEAFDNVVYGPLES